MSTNDNVVTFRAPQAQHLAEALQRPRAEAFHGMCGSVSSMTKELRAWNADVVLGPQWRCVHEGTSQMADPVVYPWKLGPKSESPAFFDTLYELAEALGDFAHELGIQPRGGESERRCPAGRFQPD
jgi:hypothetical protein